MSDNNVKNYTAKQLLDRVKSLPSFQYIPKTHWLLFVRSNEDGSDVFDDKCYLFRGEDFIMVSSCTTNPGAKGLKNYQRNSLLGTYVAKSDQWNYECWREGFHRNRMWALKQVRSILGYRDNNGDLKSDEIGAIQSGLYGINFHTVDYDLEPSFWRRFIGGWSVGCFVLNSVGKYISMMDRFKRDGVDVSMVIIKEF